MSIDYAVTLMRRANEYLASAERNLREGLLDVACLEAEVAAQLAVKGVIVKLALPRHAYMVCVGF